MSVKIKRGTLKKAVALQKQLESLKGRVEALDERIFNEFSCDSDQMRVSKCLRDSIKDTADYAGALVRVLNSANNAED